jgi:hypothetical protein
MNHDEKVEVIAARQHDLWCALTKTLASKETLNPDRLRRWETFWKPYAELSDGQKERARMEAEKLLELIGE